MRVPSFTPNYVCCFGEYVLHQQEHCDAFRQISWLSCL